MVENSENKEASAIVHYCKICNRGFSCGGALGGHMRAHNIAEVINRMQEQESDFRCKSGGNKHSYFLRTTSNRFFNLQSSIRGENSGKRACFDDEKLVSPMSSVSEIEDGGTRNAYIWKFLEGRGNENYSDGSCFSREEEELANVLVTLSNNLVDNTYMYKNKSSEDVSMPLANGLFQCKACKKVFSSHQALGGHRASHKKVKGCYAAKLDDFTDDEKMEEDSISHDEFSMPQDSLDDSMFNLSHPTSQKTSDHDPDQDSKMASKVHECSICHRVFSSGQALGGHKRCHWLQTDSTFMTPFHDQFQYYGAENNYRKSTISCKDSELFDLNLPPDQSNDIVDDKSTTTYLSPKMNVGPDENQGNYHDCKNLKKCGKQSSKTLHGYDHKYNGEEGRISKLAKHSNVRELELDRGSSPWLQISVPVMKPVKLQLKK